MATTHKAVSRLTANNAGSAIREGEGAELKQNAGAEDLTYGRASRHLA